MKETLVCAELVLLALGLFSFTAIHIWERFTRLP